MRTVASVGATVNLIGFGFTQEQINRANIVYLEPHTADLWVSISPDHRTPVPNNGHRVLPGIGYFPVFHHPDIDNLIFNGQNSPVTISLHDYRMRDDAG